MPGVAHDTARTALQAATARQVACRPRRPGAHCAVHSTRLIVARTRFISVRRARVASVGGLPQLPAPTRLAPDATGRAATGPRGPVTQRAVDSTWWATARLFVHPWWARQATVRRGDQNHAVAPRLARPTRRRTRAICPPRAHLTIHGAIVCIAHLCLRAQPTRLAAPVWHGSHAPLAPREATVAFRIAHSPGRPR